MTQTKKTKRQEQKDWVSDKISKEIGTASALERCNFQKHPNKEQIRRKKETRSTYHTITLQQFWVDSELFINLCAFHFSFQSLNPDFIGCYGVELFEGIHCLDEGKERREKSQRMQAATVLL